MKVKINFKQEEGGEEERGCGKERKKGKEEGRKEVRKVHSAGGRTEEDEWVKKDVVQAV